MEIKEVRTSLNQGETDDDAEARTEIWSIEGDFIHRHHVEPRVAAPRAERRKIPKSTEIYRRDQDHTHMPTRTCLATIPATARHDHLWPAIWSGTAKAAQRKEGKTALGDRETEARQCEKVERHLFFFFDPEETQGHIGNSWKPQCC